MNQQPSPLKALAFKFDSPVNSLCFSQDGETLALGLGNGGVHIATGDDRKTHVVHTGAVPVIKPYEGGFITLSDDGTAKTIAPDGTIKDFADFKGVWTERMDVHVNGSVAIAVGKNVHLWTNRDADPKIIGPHDGSVTDVHFAPDGMGMAAAHRDGVTLWAWPHYEPQPMKLGWKGAHLSVTISADKRWIVTGMQEGALHLWNVALKRDYQMRGYWAKPTSLAWSRDKKWLATSGSETVIIWPFDKGGPDGRDPLQLGWSNATFVTQVAPHPDENVIAAGFEDGAVILVDLENKKAFNAAAPSGSPITALQFSPDGRTLAAGSANGGAVRFSFD